MNVASRVAKLPHAALVELVVAACEGSPAIKNRADALVAQAAPLPAWCVEVLLSPDLLSACFSSLKLTDARVAATCRAWQTAWSRQLVALRPVLPLGQRKIVRMPCAFGLCVQADGTLVVACSYESSGSHIRFVSSNGTLSYLGHTGQATLSVGHRQHYQTFHEEQEIAREALKFDWARQLLHSDGAMFMSDKEVIRRIGPDGTELANYRHPDAFEDACRPCTVVHQPSGVLLAAVTLEAEHGLKDVVLLLDAATLKLRLVDGEASKFAPQVLCDDYRKYVAVDGDLVLVTEVTAWGTAVPEHNRRAQEDFTANLLHVFNIDGTLIRTFEGCGFGPPCAMVADQGRVYLIEDGEATEHDLPEDCEECEWAGRRLFVIDIETGSVLQKVRIEEATELSAVAVHGDEVFISDYQLGCVFVLNIAVPPA